MYEFGFHASFQANKFLPQTNLISNSLFVRESRIGPGFGIGMQYSMGPPKDQTKRGWDPKLSALFESTICQCNSYLNAAVDASNGKKSLLNLNFIFYRFELNSKIVLSQKRTQILLGPTISYTYYVGYRIDQESSIRSATSSFNTLNVGYEYGLGYKIGKMNLSIRRNTFVLPFGKGFRGQSFDTKNWQYRIIMAFMIKQKHKGKNWDSIIWD